ncbi:MAG: hypothetical protein LBS75_06980 [Synergistaceae bacterium]|jgi:hypothetical protein|nr:hypothetical protein [Synergistaceae bacterium]
MAGEPRIISFDADYMRGYSKKNIASAQKLIEEAIGELRSASVNSGWSCPERDEINNRLRSDIAKKLYKIKDTALVGLSSALVEGAAKFDEWESRGTRQEEDFFSRLKKMWGFEAKAWSPSNQKSAVESGKRDSVTIPAYPVPPNPKANPPKLGAAPLPPVLDWINDGNIIGGVIDWLNEVIESF